MSITGADKALSLARLHARCFDSSWSAEFLAGLLSDPTILCHVIEEQGLPVGLVLAQTVAGESEILTLAIDPDHRRCGLGRRLMALVSDQLARQGVEILFLEVSELNEAAIRLYRSQGFEVMGRRKHYYATANGPADALTMRLDLNS